MQAGMASSLFCCNMWPRGGPWGFSGPLLCLWRVLFWIVALLADLSGIYTCVAHQLRCSKSLLILLPLLPPLLGDRRFFLFRKVLFLSGKYYHIIGKYHHWIYSVWRCQSVAAPVVVPLPGLPRKVKPNSPNCWIKKSLGDWCNSATN